MERRSATKTEAACFRFSIEERTRCVWGPLPARPAQGTQAVHASENPLALYNAVFTRSSLTYSLNA